MTFDRTVLIFLAVGYPVRFSLTINEFEFIGLRIPAVSSGADKVFG